jgi:hypothetical protein
MLDLLSIMRTIDKYQDCFSTLESNYHLSIILLVFSFTKKKPYLFPPWNYVFILPGNLRHVHPRILNFSSRCIRMVNLSFFSLYPRGKKPLYPLNGRLGDIKTCLDTRQKQEPIAFTGTHIISLGASESSLITMASTLSRLFITVNLPKFLAHAMS